MLCTDTQEGHVTSRAGSNQMNPFHYLHLPDQKVDIRGSQIALNFGYTNHGQTTTMLAVNFIDGRWPKIVQEPEQCIKEILQGDVYGSVIADPFFIQHVYFTSIMRWWSNALNSIHEQLVAYVGCGTSRRRALLTSFRKSVFRMTKIYKTRAYRPIRRSAGRFMRSRRIYTVTLPS